MRTYWIALALASALLPAAALAHGGPEVFVKGVVRAGGSIDVSGEEFPQGSLVTIELRRDGGEPVALGAVPVDNDEEFEATLHVPDDLLPGLYQLVAVGGDESASVEVTVLEAAEGAVGSAAAAPAVPVINDRPVSEIVALAILTAAVAALGALLLRLGRTRPRGAGA